MSRNPHVTIQVSHAWGALQKRGFKGAEGGICRGRLKIKAFLLGGTAGGQALRGVDLREESAQLGLTRESLSFITEDGSVDVRGKDGDGEKGGRVHREK